MASPSRTIGPGRVVVDNIHGSIELSDLEWNVVNTASFQRLRWLKQLGMGHLTYPNATHNRFAHSLGVFGIMRRITDLLSRQNPGIDEYDLQNLRLAALLHDIGHYPYSHLMERVERVTLTEEEVCRDEKRTLSTEKEAYPDHETLGRHIVGHQSDLIKAIGSEKRAQEIGALFSRTEAAHPQLSKLIHSSLDMDRLDYLLRDARATGVPYGEIDINYLLNNIRISPEGVIGVEYKALAAAEHFLLARLFMHRTVYFHKTTYALEEACRQPLRRIRDTGKYEMHEDGRQILNYCSGPTLSDFTDDFVDRIIRKATQDENPVINTLANCITNRKPPKLLKEVSGLQEKGKPRLDSVFRTNCRFRLSALADKFNLPVGQFLLCGPKPIKIEERGPLFTRDEAKKLETEEREELIKVFVPGEEEPRSIVEINDCLIRLLSGHQFGICRLYLADDGPEADARFKKIQAEVSTWTEDQ